MIAFLAYPLYLLIFWYKDVTLGLLGFFAALNRYMATLLSLPNLFRTFFKPLKNEYRDGLVLFSRCFGMVIKTVLISVSLLILLLMLLIEVFIVLFIVLLPILLFVLLISPKTLLR